MIETEGLRKFDKNFKGDYKLLESLKANLRSYELDKLEEEVKNLIFRLNEDLAETENLIKKLQDIALRNMETRIKGLEFLKFFKKISKSVIPEDVEKELDIRVLELGSLNDFSIDMWKAMLLHIDSFKKQIEKEFSTLKKYNSITKISKWLLPLFFFLISSLTIPPPYGIIIGGIIAILEHSFIEPKFKSYLKRKFLFLYLQIFHKRMGISLLNSMLIDVNPILEKTLIQSEKQLFIPKLDAP